MITLDQFRYLCDTQRWNYLFRSAVATCTRKRYACSACGSDLHVIIKRKTLLTALVRCEACHLLFRVPTDPPAFGKDFYQGQYHSGFTTDCPEPEVLKALVAANFVGTPKDFSHRIHLLTSLGIKPGARVLDYGASWGYGCWQLQRHGFEAVGFELSKPRARYAREKLQQQVVDDIRAIEGKFDVFFTCHVLEHLPSPTDALRFARQVLRPGGLLVAITPNGSTGYLQKDSRAYHRHWGMVHPCYLDDEYYWRMFPDTPKLACTNPYDNLELSSWDRRGDKVLDLTGWELLFVAAV